MQSSSSSSTSSRQPQQSPRVQHAIDWFAAYTGWDFNTLYSLTTTADDFQYAWLPSTFGLPPKGMKEWHLYNDLLKSMLPDFRGEVLSLYESTGESDAVIAHAAGRATSNTGAQFHQEYIMIIHIREENPNSLPPASPSSVSSQSAAPDGSSSLNLSFTHPALKVYRVFEFVDTQFCAAFFPEEMERSRSQLQHQRQGTVVGVIQQPDQPVESTRIAQLNAGAGDAMQLAKL